MRREEHRVAAVAALSGAQRNPVLSAGESFLAAQVHALLAIEQRIGELVDVLRERSSAPGARESTPTVRLA